MSQPSEVGNETCSCAAATADCKTMMIKNRSARMWATIDACRPAPQLEIGSRCSAYGDLAGVGFQRLGNTSLTSWFFMEGKRLSTSVRYSCGLSPYCGQFHMAGDRNWSPKTPKPSAIWAGNYTTACGVWPNILVS